jgi:hypothetical protein
MRPTYRATIVSVLTSSLLTFGLGACSDNTTPAVDPEFTADLTNDVGTAEADEVDESMGALQTGSGAADFAAASTSTVSLSPSIAASIALYRPWRAACATVDNTTDTDADGFPDQVVFTFALPDCHFTNFRGGTLDITGTITLSDPTPNSADFAVLMSLGDFTLHHVNAIQTRSFTTVRNGVRALTASAIGATLTNTVTTVRSVTGRADATISHNTSLTFTPDEGQTLARGQPLPSGTFVKSGSLVWSRNDLSRTFTVTTVTPLRWDASCTTDRKIAEGEIHWTLSDGNYVKMVWTGCGIDPVRTFVRVG